MHVRSVLSFPAGLLSQISATDGRQAIWALVILPTYLAMRNVNNVAPLKISVARRLEGILVVFTAAHGVVPGLVVQRRSHWAHPAAQSSTLSQARGENIGATSRVSATHEHTATHLETGTSACPRSPTTCSNATLSGSIRGRRGPDWRANSDAPRLPHRSPCWSGSGGSGRSQSTCCANSGGAKLVKGVLDPIPASLSTHLLAHWRSDDLHATTPESISQSRVARAAR